MAAKWAHNVAGQSLSFTSGSTVLGPIPMPRAQAVQLIGELCREYGIEGGTTNASRTTATGTGARTPGKKRKPAKTSRAG